MGQLQSSAVGGITSSKTLPTVSSDSSQNHLLHSHIESPKVKPSKGSDTMKGSSRSTSTSVSINKSSDKREASERNQSSNRTSEKPALVNVDDYPVNDLIPLETWAGQKVCQEDIHIRQAFVTFILSMNWLEEITLRLVDILGKRISTQELSDHITFNEYMMYHRSRSASTDQKDRDEIAAKMMRVTQLKARDSMDVSTFRKTGSIQTCFHADQLKHVVLASLWPLFKQSAEYKALTCPPQSSNQQSSDSVSTSISNSSETEANATVIKAPATSPNASKVNDMEKIKRVKDILYQNCHHWKEEDISVRLKEGKWLETLIQAIEDNHFSVSVASADPKKAGYPMIFVNKSFEKLTQYDRAEVLGRNCKVLQGNRTEKDYIHKLGETLQKGLGLKLAIANYRKDGSEFTNFLALRPVYDREEMLTYFVGVQYDIGKEDATMKDVKMIEDFLLLMCNIMRG